MNQNNKMVSFLYGNLLGRILLKMIMKLHIDRIIVKFLCSSYSKSIIPYFIEHNNIDIPSEQKETFKTFRDCFARTNEYLSIDETPEHLISPCDGYLSVFPIDKSSTFSIKKSHYKLTDFLKDEELSKKYIDGTCLIFRLCVSDYHHYCFIDDGYQGENHYIEGQLHSVQPIACETIPVYVLNRRSWALLSTHHFGNVIQCEIGALVVGGIVNEIENNHFKKGDEKGHFELAGSTIVLLFEKNKIKLNPEYSQEEVKVKLGQWIGNSI